MVEWVALPTDSGKGTQPNRLALAQGYDKAVSCVMVMGTGGGDEASGLLFAHIQSTHNQCQLNYSVQQWNRPQITG